MSTQNEIRIHYRTDGSIDTARHVAVGRGMRSAAMHALFRDAAAQVLDLFKRRVGLWSSDQRR
jgi:hypothetical protein